MNISEQRKNGEAQRENIETKLKEVAEEIRAYSRAQKEMWRKVPYLAVEAAAKDGYLGQYSKDYRYWTLKSHRGANLDACVDLATGELLKARAAASADYYTVIGLDVVSPKRSKHIPVDDQTVIAIDLEALNAEKLIQQLTEKAQKPYRFDVKEQREIEQWRKKTREELKVKLERLYARTG